MNRNQAESLFDILEKLEEVRNDIRYHSLNPKTPEIFPELSGVFLSHELRAPEFFRILPGSPGLVEMRKWGIFTHFLRILYGQNCVNQSGNRPNCQEKSPSPPFKLVHFGPRSILHLPQFMELLKSPLLVFYLALHFNLLLLVASDFLCLDFVLVFF